jgi:hypothetical protein
MPMASPLQASPAAAPMPYTVACTDVASSMTPALVRAVGSIGNDMACAAAAAGPANVWAGSTVPWASPTATQQSLKPTRHAMYSSPGAHKPGNAPGPVGPRLSGQGTPPPTIRYAAGESPHPQQQLYTHRPRGASLSNGTVCPTTAAVAARYRRSHSSTGLTRMPTWGSDGEKHTSNPNRQGGPSSGVSKLQSLMQDRMREQQQLLQARLAAATQQPAAWPA